MLDDRNTRLARAEQRIGHLEAGIEALDAAIDELWSAIRSDRDQIAVPARRRSRDGRDRHNDTEGNR